MQVRTEIRPGDIGRIIHLHGTLYAREYALDYTFEGYVAAGLGQFAKAYDERKDRLWVAEEGEQLAGTIAIAGHLDGTAQLRWFLVHTEARGSGLGRKLLSEAIEFCHARGFKSVFLWTISELKAAAHLYREAGFQLTEQKAHALWGGARVEERYDLVLRGG
jgi:ribosomal protein S18 acetylase RimI-like enzyme